MFQKANVELLRVKTTSFADLLVFMRDAEADGCCVAIIDSITAFWKDLTWQYRVEKAKARLSKKDWFVKMAVDRQAEKLDAEARSMRLDMRDWAPIKDTWGRFSSLYLDSQMHAIVCGRLGFEWDFTTDEDGHKELVKVGTKMKTEGEMAYEPSLLLEMAIIKPTPAEVKAGANSKWIHRCTVLKDRTDLLNGSVIDNPTFESFAPVIGFLNIAGTHVAIEPQQAGGRLFSEGGESRGQELSRLCTIAEEEIKEALVLAELDGNSADAKKRRAHLLRECFGTSAWTAITSSGLDNMRTGLLRMRAELGQDGGNGGAPPGAAPAPAGPTATVDPDQLPDTY
jgi:hypothetical protein